MISTDLDQQISERCPCYALPLTDCRCQPAPFPELAGVEESLAVALSWLENAACLLRSSGQSGNYSQLSTALADAIHHCQEANEHLNDSPDSGEAESEALEHLFSLLDL